MIAVRAIAFGDLDTGTWGLSWLPEPGGPARLAVRRGGGSQLVEGVLETANEDDAPWRVEADGASLSFTPTGPPVQGGSEAVGVQTLDQLCEVTGRLALGEEEAELRSLGWRSSVQGGADYASLDSFRFLAGWLDPHQGFSLLALRPRKARGHDADMVAAAVIDDPSLPRIDDPRLSTTYTESGRPARAGLELWFEEKDEEDAENAHHYPRRAAGEEVGDGLGWDQDGFALSASLLRWHSHGGEGPGVYVLGRSR